MALAPSKEKVKKVYQDNAIEAAVYGASPVGLIVLLYEGALQAIKQAKLAIEQRNYSAKSACISKAVDIIEGLRVTLDPRHEEEMARNLEDLYQYAKLRLNTANLRNDTALLDEVGQVLSTLLSAWQQVDKITHKKTESAFRRSGA